MLSPNPFRERFSVTGPQNGACQIEVTNLLGRTVFAYKGTLTEINARLEKATAPLPTGNYWVKLTDIRAQQQHCFKLAKIN